MPWQDKEKQLKLCNNQSSSVTDNEAENNASLFANRYRNLYNKNLYCTEIRDLEKELNDEIRNEDIKDVK